MADEQLPSTADTGQPISGREKSLTPEKTANNDANNCTSASQSAVSPTLLEVERCIGTASNGESQPIIEAPIATWTPPAERSANPTRSLTGKKTEPEQITPTAAPQPQPPARQTGVQHKQTTPGHGNGNYPTMKDTPRTGTNGEVVRQIQEYVIDRVVGSE